MSFLTPLFLVGLGALAIPVFLHLIQRERKNIVEFPSLMFLRRIPYQSVRRRRIRNWLLLALRLAALALIVLAFARPFLRRPVAAAAAGGAREVVILVDRSYSMGYADRWQRAIAAARDAVGRIGPGDRGSIVFFASSAEVALRSTADRARLASALAAARPSAGATKFGPALKLAGSILSESPLPRREAVLISDFQRGGWQGSEGVRLPDGATMTAVPITDAQTANLSVTPVSLQRSTFSGQERVTVTSGVINRSSRPAAGVEIALELDGRAVQTQRVSADANGSASVTFEPITVAAPNTRASVRIAADALERDNVFDFVLSPVRPVKVVVVERSGSSPGSSLYLARALAVGESPRFDAAVKSADALTAGDLEAAAVVVLNDAPIQPSTADRLARFLQRGGGLLLAAAERASWPANGPDVLPASLGDAVDRSRGDAARLGALEYGHPVFEMFRAPRSGDFSSARFYGYRALVPVPGSQVLARFDDGGPAVVERRVGNGRAIAWASTLDVSWNDLPLKPVFLPFVHSLVTHLAAYTEPPASLTIGDVLDPTRAGLSVQRGRASAAIPVILSPSGQRVMLDGEGPDVLELEEQGFYEVRAQARGGDAGVSVASNVDLAESDLTAIDPQELVAAAEGHASGTRTAAADAAATAEVQERTQRVWWYLLFAGILLLGAETFVANSVSLKRT